MSAGFAQTHAGFPVAERSVPEAVICWCQESLHLLAVGELPLQFASGLPLQSCLTV